MKALVLRCGAGRLLQAGRIVDSLLGREVEVTRSHARRARPGCSLEIAPRSIFPDA
jgi:hypothetical protein